MKKNLFLLGTFMASSLVTANTLLVISCKKKASVKDNKEDEKSTEEVELKAATRVKDEIKNIIDDVITNPNDESADWIIKLNEGLNDTAGIIKTLNDKVEELKASSDKDKK